MWWEELLYVFLLCLHILIKMSFNDLLDLLLTSLTIIVCCSTPSCPTRRARYKPCTTPTMTSAAAFVKTLSLKKWVICVVVVEHRGSKRIDGSMKNVSTYIMFWWIKRSLLWNLISIALIWWNTSAPYIHATLCQHAAYLCSHVTHFFVKMQHNYVDMQHNLTRILTKLPR